MGKATSQLLEALDRERIKLQMSDAQFSRCVLGISPSYLCRLKNGERAITLDLLKLFMQKLPEITPAVTIYFMSQGDGDTPGGDSPKTITKQWRETLPSEGILGLPSNRGAKPSKNAHGGES